MKYLFDLWIKLLLKFYLQILFRYADRISTCRYFLNLQINISLFNKDSLVSRSDLKQVFFSTSYKSYSFCNLNKSYRRPFYFWLLHNSERQWANKKKHSITYLFIKLPDVFMKEMKRKLNWKCISISAGVIKIYLV